MPSIAFAGLLWLSLGAHICIRYYTDEPYTVIAIATASSQVAMALADAIDALGLSPTDIIAIGAIAVILYDLRYHIAHIATSVYNRKK